jgi:hypothetical protein
MKAKRPTPVEASLDWLNKIDTRITDYFDWETRATVEHHISALREALREALRALEENTDNNPQR